jgi:hypothetical protein
MALKLLHATQPQLPPHRQALRDNLRNIKDARARVTAIHERDVAAAADIALADATQGRIATLTEQIDTLRAEATYNGDPPPDLKHLDLQLRDAQQLYKQQSDRARAAANVRVKYTADMAALNSILSEHARHTQRLLWTALREELGGLAVEFLAAEAAMLAVHRKAFAAALACDVISREQAYGEFTGSGNINDLNISRPAHDAFNRNPTQTVEQAHAERKAYIKSASDAAAALVLELLAVAD